MRGNMARRVLRRPSFSSSMKRSQAMLVPSFQRSLWTCVFRVGKQVSKCDRVIVGRQHWCHLDHTGVLEHLLWPPFDHIDTANVLNIIAHLRFRLRAGFATPAPYLSPRQAIKVTSRCVCGLHDRSVHFGNMRRSSRGFQVCRGLQFVQFVLAVLRRWKRERSSIAA
ncbi:hypothetical protein FI667_g16865, partial [Globisporangium splendens]